MGLAPLEQEINLLLSSSGFSTTPALSGNCREAPREPAGSANKDARALLTFQIEFDEKKNPPHVTKIYTHTHTLGGKKVVA